MRWCLSLCYLPLLTEQEQLAIAEAAVGRLLEQEWFLGRNQLWPLVQRACRRCHITVTQRLMRQYLGFYVLTRRLAGRSEAADRSDIVTTHEILRETRCNNLLESALPRRGSGHG